jgi:hypothetical protein
LQENPQDSEAYLRRGRLYGQKLSYHEAEKDFPRSIATRGASVRAHFARGKVRWNQGKVGGALSDYFFAIESSGIQFGDFKYNASSMTEVPDFAQDQAAVMNQVYSFTLSPLGKITNIKIPSGILDKIKKLMEDSGAGKLGIDTEEAGKAFDENGFGRILNLFFMTFPDGEAEVEVPWKVETEGNPPFDAFQICIRLQPDEIISRLI